MRSKLLAFNSWIVGVGDLLDVGADLGAGFGVSVSLLPKPRDNAERVVVRGGSLRGGRATVFSRSTLVRGLEGICGGPPGLGGILGGTSRSTIGACLRTTGADLIYDINLLILHDQKKMKASGKIMIDALGSLDSN